MLHLLAPSRSALSLRQLSAALRELEKAEHGNYPTRAPSPPPALQRRINGAMPPIEPETRTTMPLIDTDTSAAAWLALTHQRAKDWTRAHPELAAALWLDVCRDQGFIVGTVLPKGGLRANVLKAAYYEAVRAAQGWPDLVTWIQDRTDHARAQRVAYRV